MNASTQKVTRLLGAAAVALALPAVGQVTPCGTVVTNTLRLTANMYCPNQFQSALLVGGHSVRIELNGYEIVGSPANTLWLSSSAAIDGRGLFGGYSKVQVIGPGVIRDFLWDIVLEGGREHEVTGITGYSLGGIQLRGSSDSLIYKNLVSTVSISRGPGPASGNRVFSNRIGDPQTWGGGVGISGCDTSGNIVSGNEINGYVTVDYGAHQNAIEDNKIRTPAFRDQAVLFGEAYLNRLVNNVIEVDRTLGVSINPFATPQYASCNVGVPGTNGDRNQIERNSIWHATTGVRVGPLRPTGQVLGTGNIIRGNTIGDTSGPGLMFAPDTAYNDAHRNTYVNVPVAVEDLGRANVWP